VASTVFLGLGDTYHCEGPYLEPHLFDDPKNYEDVDLSGWHNLMQDRASRLEISHHREASRKHDYLDLVTSNRDMSHRRNVSSQHDYLDLIDAHHLTSHRREPSVRPDYLGHVKIFSRHDFSCDFGYGGD
jgi:hypothetical protein